MKKINVLITALGSVSNGMQILKALKLSDLPYHFIGVDMDPQCYGSIQVDQFFALPPADDREYLSALLKIIQKNDVHVLFCGSENELLKISQNRKIFDQTKTFLAINPHSLIEIYLDKFKTMNLLKEKDFNVPMTKLVTSIEDINNMMNFPFVCKPFVNSGGSKNVFIAQDQSELAFIANSLLANIGPFIVQEYIGSYKEEYTVGVLADLDGHIIDSIALKRNLTSMLSYNIKVPNKTNKSDFGPFLAISSGVSQGQLGRFKTINNYCEHVAQTLKIKGPFNFQCRVHGDKIYIFEINPRFSGTVSIRAMAGFNEPDIFIRKYLLGEKFNRVNYKECTILRGLEERLFPH